MFNKMFVKENLIYLKNTPFRILTQFKYILYKICNCTKAINTVQIIHNEINTKLKTEHCQ